MKEIKSSHIPWVDNTASRSHKLLNENSSSSVGIPSWELLTGKIPDNPNDVGNFHCCQLPARIGCEDPIAKVILKLLSLDIKQDSWKWAKKYQYQKLFAGC